MEEKKAFPYLIDLVLASSKSMAYITDFRVLMISCDISSNDVRWLY